MASSAPEALRGAVTFDSADLWRRHPPKFHSRNKKRVLALATAAGGPTGPVTVSRFGAIDFPAEIPRERPALDVTPDVFTYAPKPEGTLAWHVNFADPFLFFGCSGPAFAQDEIQVAEHPVLAAVRASLNDSTTPGLAALTVEGEVPTPVLIEGAPRQCAITLQGIYGRAFDRAKEEAIQSAVRPLVPPTLSNIVAMSAPTGGTGEYSRAQIAFTLRTAWTAFSSVRYRSGGATVAIHTGHWGTGAFGGDRVLMAAIQLFAARLSRVDRVAFHAVDTAGVEPVKKASALLATRGFELAESVDDVLDELSSKGFRWGVSDGN